MTENKQKCDVLSSLSLIKNRLKEIDDRYFVGSMADEMKSHENAVVRVTELERAKVSAIERVKNLLTFGTSKNELSNETVEVLKALKNSAQQLMDRPQYNFFRIGYYVYKHPDTDMSLMSADEANEVALQFLNEDYLISFMKLVKLAVQYSFDKNIENKKAAVKALEEAITFFRAGSFTSSKAEKVLKFTKNCVAASLDPLAIVKDNVAYTFASSIDREVEKYFFYEKNNPKEEARFVRQTAKREALIAKGKNVEWKVVPKSVIGLDVQIENIVTVLSRVLTRFKEDIQTAGSFNAEKRCLEIIDFLKSKASQVVYTLTKRIAKKKAIKLMEEVGIPEARIRYRQYPFEFSGGMRQRIVIAIALSANPDILICDEPTTALDVTIQAQILELINRLKREHNLSIIFITHDLGVVANMADRIAVMYAGKIVEYGTAEEVFYNPQHPYTWALLSSMPDLDTNEKLDAIPGTPPNMIYPPVGDAFAERNKYAMEIDFEMQPPMYEVSPTHYAATWLLHPNAPKVEIPKIITERIRRMKERGGNHGE